MSPNAVDEERAHRVDGTSTYTGILDLFVFTVLSGDLEKDEKIRFFGHFVLDGRGD